MSTLRVVRLRVVAVAVLLAVVAAGCGVREPEGVRIGVVAPLTGDRTYLGIEMERGARLAVEDINAAGGLLGVPVELVVLDDADLVGLPGQLSELAEQERVTAIIGPEAPGVLLGPRSPLTRRGVPALLPTAFAGDLTQAGSLVLRSVPSAEAQAEALGRWLSEERRITEIALLVADPVEGRDVVAPLRAGLGQGGVTVVALVEADGTAVTLGPAVDSLRRQSGDAPSLLIWGPPQVAARATIAVREQGWDVQIAVPASSFVAEYRSLAGDATEGVVIPFPFRDEWFGSTLFQWMLRYYVMHGFGALPQLDTLVVDLPIVAVASYDAVGMVADAVTLAGSADPEAVSAALEQVTHDGILRDYTAVDRETWPSEELFIGRFHQFGVVFDADGRLDPAAQAIFWEQQVNAEFVPDSVINGPGGAVIGALLDRGREVDKIFELPLPGPAPVARP